MHTATEGYVRAATVEQVRKAGRLVMAIGGHTVLLIHEHDHIYASYNFV